MDYKVHRRDVPENPEPTLTRAGFIYAMRMAGISDPAQWSSVAEGWLIAWKQKHRSLYPHLYGKEKKKGPEKPRTIVIVNINLPLSKLRDLYRDFNGINKTEKVTKKDIADWISLIIEDLNKQE